MVEENFHSRGLKRTGMKDLLVKSHSIFPMVEEIFEFLTVFLNAQNQVLLTNSKRPFIFGLVRTRNRTRTNPLFFVNGLSKAQVSHKFWLVPYYPPLFYPKSFSFSISPPQKFTPKLGKYWKFSFKMWPNWVSIWVYD